MYAWKKLIIVDKFTYRRDKETGLGAFHRCTVKNCKASVPLDMAEGVLLRNSGSHKHPFKENLNIRISFFIHFIYYAYLLRFHRKYKMQ